MTSKLPWGEVPTDEEVDEVESRHETEPNAQGIKYVTEYRTNEQGKRVKITKKIRVYSNVRKINTRAEERRKRWIKFGKCAGVEGIEPGVTGIGEDVSLVLGDEERKAKQKIAEEKRDEEEMKRMLASIMTPQRPGMPPGPTGTTPTQPVWRPRFNTIQGPPKTTPTTTTPARPTPNPNAYIPPRLRQPGAPGATTGNEDDASTIRVTNLSEDTTEEDIRNLFRPFGEIGRIFLAKDKISQKSKGFAFINFKYRDNAQAAMNALNGKGFDYLILNIEWAKPSTH